MSLHGIVEDGASPEGQREARSGYTAANSGEYPMPIRVAACGLAEGSAHEGAASATQDLRRDGGCAAPWAAESSRND